MSVLILAGMCAAWSLLWFAHSHEMANTVLLIAIALTSAPILLELAGQLLQANFSVDVLAAISICSAVAFREYWVAAIVILMLSGGKSLEAYATRRASSTLGALARRMPSIAHRIGPDGGMTDVAIASVAIGDTLVLHPHELCPVDGAVIRGDGEMDESYLTGEPFLIAKAPGASVLSGSINGDRALTIKCTRVASDSRYARIVEILHASEENRPRMRRLGDRLGAWYTPAAIALAILSWALSGDPDRFLAVLVIATPCPLLLAIPITIIGAISTAARRGIIIKDPTILEAITSCTTLIIDKTGTMTYGRPILTEVICISAQPRRQVLQLSAALEQYSKHPLGVAVLAAAKEERIPLPTPDDVFEIPGHGLTAHIDGHLVTLTARSKLPEHLAQRAGPTSAGLESVVLIDGDLAGILRFRDEPRAEGKPFLKHISLLHGIHDVFLLSGDRPSEVEAFAHQMEIHQSRGGASPEEKVAIVRQLTAKGPTLYVGDGINDAPAMLNATAGVALGVNSDITSQAAGAVILQSSLAGVDELMHIGASMKSIALVSAIGGMGLSAIGMAASALGYLRPIEGAILQEVIDLLAILNALRILLTGDVGDFKPPVEVSPHAVFAVPANRPEVAEKKRIVA
ncbi:MAG TPA: heavy metal translocating P-type ATPase [Acidobacteriaceae bacterium]|nr:heavy metal translocating P-type ATPase [Acidobacteriaceae bacterium]